MKTILRIIVLTVITAGMLQVSQAQVGWPKTVITPDGITIKVYPFQPDSFSGNTLKSVAAFSVTNSANTEPLFGSFWSTAKIETDREARTLTILSLKVTALKLPADSDKAMKKSIRSALEASFPAAAGNIGLDDLLASLEQETNALKLSSGINTAAPQFIYSPQQAILVTIDGTPIIQKNKRSGLNQVVNSPFTIVQDNDKKFYLYGGQNWYTAPAATGPYQLVTTGVDHKLKKLEKEMLKSKANEPATTDNLRGATEMKIPAIVVSLVPAELISVDGAPQFIPITGTSLLYVDNTTNDLFLDTKTQRYYILVAGRWYESGVLGPESQWAYIGSDKLPADFAKIPEGSPKDNVLASVAGTKQAKEAVMDAQIPQTAKIDRKTATTKVTYDGNPQFSPIAGTDLQYAINTSSTVLQQGNSYYVVDNGVWFRSSSAVGPWIVSATRPSEVNAIPPTSPVYNCKFVDIYDVSPDYIYMGYTPGYLNSYIYGPTLVYGTGFYYRPWIGSYYYPRPCSWGFGMAYNPWFGWGFGLSFGYNWFDFSIGGYWGGYFGSWWGPSFYLPTCWGYSRGYRPNSIYGRNIAFRSNNRIRTGNNIYHSRAGVIEGNRDNFSKRVTVNPSRHGALPVTAHNTRAVYSDRDGNTFQRNDRGQWQTAGKRSNPADDRVVNDLNRQNQLRETGQLRTQNFQRARSFSIHSGFQSAGFGGGGFRSGGFRGGSGGIRR